MGDRHGACFVFSEVTLVHGEFWSWSLHWVACGWLTWQLLCFSLFLLPERLSELLGLAQTCPASALPL